MKRNIKCVHSQKKDRNHNGLYGTKDKARVGRAGPPATMIRRRPFSRGKTRPYFSAKSGARTWRKKRDGGGPRNIEARSASVYGARADEQEHPNGPQLRDAPGRGQGRRPRPADSEP